jgi:hypothetical protein
MAGRTMAPDEPGPRQSPMRLEDRYVRQASWHQSQALTALAHIEQLAADGLRPEQQRERLLCAFSEAVMAWRVLQQGQQSAPTGEKGTRLSRRLAKIYALAESIEQVLYAPGAAQEAHGRRVGQ